MIDLFMIEICKTPGVSNVTIAEIIRVESGGNENSLNLNGELKLQRQPRSKAEAIAVARVLRDRNESFDMGLMQINSTNLPALGLTVEAAFDPCINIKTGSLILKNAYERAIRKFGEGQIALQGALSIYNTGHIDKGHSNGYVGKFYKRSKKEEDAYSADIVVSFTSNP